MQDTQQETASVPSAYTTARRAERDGAPATDLGRLRWGLRIAGAIFALIGGATISLAHFSDLGWEFHVINGLIFVGVILMAYALATISRRSHVQLERRYRARLFIRNLELQDMAMRDDLTQLFNRRYFFERLRRELTGPAVCRAPCLSWCWMSTGSRVSMTPTVTRWATSC